MTIESPSTSGSDPLQASPAGDPDLPWDRLTALVLGASGMIGRHTVDALLRRGVRVRALVRPTSRSRNLEGLPVESLTGDAARLEDLRAALTGCDLLFHCAAPYPRSHFHRESQVRAAEAAIASVLAAAREAVAPELLHLPPGRLAQRAMEEAEGAAAILRLQPDREAEAARALRQPALLEPARNRRLNASLHPPLAETWQLPGLKRIVYVSSLTTIGRPHGCENPLAPAPTPASARLAHEGDRYDKVRASSPYFAMKDAMEAEASRAAIEGLPLVIANPGLCVDAWDAAPTTGKLLIAIARRQTPVYLPGRILAVATRDVGTALVNAVALGRTGQRYILGTCNTTAREFLELIARVAGVPPPRLPLPIALAEGIAWCTEVANLILRRPWPAIPVSGVQMMKYGQWFDTTLAREELRMPQTSIEVAVEDALRWLKENRYL